MKDWQTVADKALLRKPKDERLVPHVKPAVNSDPPEW